MSNNWIRTLGLPGFAVVFVAPTLLAFYFSREYRKWGVYKHIRGDKAIPYDEDEQDKKEDEE